ncbi:MAG: TIGR00159 family protein [Planctomycetota bacterium]|nr:MAG: TIGR00159 family protein [Planctomycetota bacterium]
MIRFEPIRQLIDRLGGYAWWEALVELAVIWGMVYLLWRFVRGTRAAAAVRVALILAVAALVIRLVIPLERFERLAFLFDNVIGMFALGLVVIFQPELRRAMIRLGEGGFFRPAREDVVPVVDAVVSACAFLSRSKFGAILAIERSVGLREFIETGRRINAEVSAPLLQAIFWPNSPLHDMGVVIRGNTILAAGVQFPLADPGEVGDAKLGTRHRAAIGLTKVVDAIVIVVSEETGSISLAERGELMQWLTPEALRAELLRRLGAPEVEARPLPEIADEPDNPLDQDQAVEDAAPGPTPKKKEEAA